MTGLTPLDIVPGTRGPDTAHVRQCDRPFSECAVCLSWFEELAECVDQGRVVIQNETTQTELPL